MFGFWKILFNTSLVNSWLVASWFLLWNLEFIFSWILILLDVFSLILILNLLTQSWHHSFGLFVIIKTTWIILDSSSWSLLLHLDRLVIKHSHNSWQRKIKERLKFGKESKVKHKKIIHTRDLNSRTEF